MKFKEFIDKFSNEEKCKEYFRDVRMKEGVTCKKCGCTKHYWLQGKWQFQCSKCRFRTTLKSGTVMHNSSLSFQKWFMIMYMMTSTKKGYSACEMARQVGHKRYNTIWSIMHRLRVAMGIRDEKYLLVDMVEFDEGFFTVETSKKDKKKLKRGKGSQKQQNVAVMAESTYLEDIETGKISKHCRYFKMKVLKNQNSEGVDSEVQKSLDNETIVFSDKSNTYFNIHEYVEAHHVEISCNEVTRTTLRWVHIAISNAKRNFLGIYHKIKRKYLQNYLNEFVYKLNRRYFKSTFERLVVASLLIS
jgi:hypothetical protein